MFPKISPHVPARDAGLKEGNIGNATSEVFFDIATQNRSLGRLEMIVYDDLVPKTTKNFKALANGAFWIILDQFTNANISL